MVIFHSYVKLPEGRSCSCVRAVSHSNGVILSGFQYAFSPIRQLVLHFPINPCCTPQAEIHSGHRSLSFWAFGSWKAQDVWNILELYHNLRLYDWMLLERSKNAVAKKCFITLDCRTDIKSLALLGDTKASGQGRKRKVDWSRDKDRKRAKGQPVRLLHSLEGSWMLLIVGNENVEEISGGDEWEWWVLMGYANEKGGRFHGISMAFK